MTLRIPNLSLVLLIGSTGCGKSTFAQKHFLATEVVSSDACRGIVSDDENSQEATSDAFDLLRTIVRTRLKNGRLTVVDATNVRAEDRRSLLKLAQEYHAMTAAIVFNLSETICLERNRLRENRNFGPHVVRQHTKSMQQSLRGLEREGFRFVYVLRSPEEVDAAEIERIPLWNDRRAEHGPFDIVGDVHGCTQELLELLSNLGYRLEPIEGPGYYRVEAPEGRKAIFLGDLVDRGPDPIRSLKIVMSMVANGVALCVPGNHDVKLVRALRGRKVTLSHGLADTVAKLGEEPEEFREEVVRFLDGLVSHFVLDNGNLVVAHAGMKEEMQGRGSGRVRDFALYGDTTGETDEFGLPLRYPWAIDYRGKARVVYGHTPVENAEWLNRTICIDTGCAFGGKLTALRYPELELVSIAAKEQYAQPVRPLGSSSGTSAQLETDDVLDLEDVAGKRVVHTRLRGNVTLREENATAALEAMSRFAANPRWLVYLPPTMSPCETSQREGWLERPEEAFAYYTGEGIGQVVCEQKHMGSRAVVVVCRDEEAARRRFGVEGEAGAVLSRMGRRLFDGNSLESAILERVRNAFDWDAFQTDWAVLDCELMPWSAKAQELLRRQYAPVAASSENALRAAVDSVTLARKRLPEDDSLTHLEGHFRARLEAAGRYREAYRRYCWPVSGPQDLKLAPFHLLATEGAVHVDKPHIWHMERLAELCSRDPDLLLATPYRVVELGAQESVEAAIRWWEELTECGGEGMVVKPFDFVAAGPKGLIQPAVKCRGREYLRIIYGPEYLLDENLSRLRQRGLGVKRSLALREFALGVEALDRFVAKEPLRRIHECVFAVLAMESEPVDPRL